MKYSFGDIVVNPESQVIEVAGKEKRLEPKLIALLTYLVQNAQHVVTRQQITEAVWPKVVVVEESVTQAIFALRNALQDDAKRPKYIATIPKKGYRFLADVTFIQPMAQMPSLPSYRGRNYTIVFGLSLLLIAALLWYGFRQKLHYEIAHILPVTTMAGAECCMAINDQRKMVFINVLGKVKDLYVKDLSTGTQERITQDDWQKGIPLWLDDNTLLYPRCANGECQIVRQNLHQSPQVIYTTTHFIGEITLKDANFLIFNQEHETSEFISFDLRSGKYEPLRNRYEDLPPHILHPILAKETNQLYFVNIDPKPLLMALNLSTKKIELISDQFDEINSFSIDHQQQLLIAGAHRSTAGVWLLSNANTPPKLIVRASSDEKLQFPLFDPMEKTLYYQSVVFDQNIAMATREQNRLDDFSELNSTSVDNLASFSKDEQFIYFISNRTGFSEVWRYDLTSKQTKAITQMKFTGISSVLVSNDGQRFSAAYIDNMQATLGVFSIHNGELLASVKAQSRPLSWSPDDNIIYTRDNQNNIPVLMSYNSQTLLGTKLQENAGLVAQETADGSSVIFFDIQRSALLERNIATGEDQLLMTIDTKVNGVWTDLLRVDPSNGLVFIVKHEKIRELWQYPFKSQDLTPRKLMDLPKDAWITFVNADGTLVLYDREMPPTGSIMKINFQ